MGRSAVRICVWRTYDAPILRANASVPRFAEMMLKFAHIGGQKNWCWNVTEKCFVPTEMQMLTYISAEGKKNPRIIALTDFYWLNL